MMDEGERYREICRPAFGEIKDSLARLEKHIIVGNGKPSLLARVDALESKRESPAANPDGRVVEFGRLKLRGYGMNDIVRAAVLVGVVVLLLDRISDRVATWRAAALPVAGMVAGEGAKP